MISVISSPYFTKSWFMGFIVGDGTNSDDYIVIVGFGCRCSPFLLAKNLPVHLSSSHQEMGQNLLTISGGTSILGYHPGSRVLTHRATDSDPLSSCRRLKWRNGGFWLTMFLDRAGPLASCHMRRPWHDTSPGTGLCHLKVGWCLLAATPTKSWDHHPRNTRKKT